MTKPALTITRQHPRIHLVTTADGARIGRILDLGKTYRASRRNGEDGVDCRRVGNGFRSLETAAAWIAKGER